MVKVIIGGTFAYLHKGHQALLRKAFAIGDFVYIGITSDAYVKRNKKRVIKSYAQRRRMLVAFVKTLGKKYRIAKLADEYGPSVTGNFDAIVVSSETYEVARKINRIRKEGGLRQLRIVKIPYVKAYDGRLVSSERIFRKEIDSSGKKRL